MRRFHFPLRAVQPAAQAAARTPRRGVPPEDMALLARADAGDAEAQADVGEMFIASGQPDAGRRWLELAAAQGHPDAMQCLARCYLSGEGAPKDEDMAIRWLAEAAARGHVIARAQMRALRDGAVRSAQAGFTLIELMIVVAVIGILAAIAVPQYAGYISRTRAAAAKVELAPVKTAVGMCIAATGKREGCSQDPPDANPVTGIPATFGPTRNVTGHYNVTDGVIKATSGATDTAGTPLTIVLTPSLAADSATMVWTESGTICHPTRGLRSGEGDCP